MYFPINVKAFWTLIDRLEFAAWGIFDALFVQISNVIITCVMKLTYIAILPQWVSNTLPTRDKVSHLTHRRGTAHENFGDSAVII